MSHETFRKEMVEENFVFLLVVGPAIYVKNPLFHVKRPNRCSVCVQICWLGLLHVHGAIVVVHDVVPSGCSHNVIVDFRVPALTCLSGNVNVRKDIQF